MKETDIRPEYLEEGHRKAIQIDHLKFLSHKSEFVDASCPACGIHNSSDNVLYKYTLRFETCPRCETMYMNPRPTTTIMAEYLAISENYKYWAEHTFPESEETRRREIANPRAAMVRDYCYGERSVLDIGAGFGTFLEEMRKLKSTPFQHRSLRRFIAIEPVPSLAEICRQKGFEVIARPIEEVELPEPVDVITAFEIIEHVFSPKDFLSKCHSLLSPKGMLILSCPNVKGFDIMTLRELSSAISFEHLNYFNPNSLSELVEDCGFRILDVSTPGKLDAELVRKKILSGEFDCSNRPYLKWLLVDEWDKIGEKFQEFLANNLLSSHMQIVARKTT